MASRSLPQLDPPAEHTRLEEQRPHAEGVHLFPSAERFDRTAFAMRVLARLRPKMTVAVYESRDQLCVHRGRRLASGEAWAMIGIPSNAGRAQIVLAVAELAGLQHVPFIVDLAVAGTGDPP